MNATTSRDRLQAWRRTGRVESLWPTISLGELKRAHRQIADVTRRLLRAEPTPSSWITAETERTALNAAAYLSGMGPLLGYWVENGLLTTETNWAADLANHLAHGRRRASRLQALSDSLARDLAAVQISPIVLKGMVTSRHYFPEPGTRPVADLDWLVTPEQFADAARILTASGLQPDTAPAVPDRLTLVPAAEDREIRSLDLDHADNPWSLDLHSSLDTRYFRGLWTRFGSLPFDHVISEERAGIRTGRLAQPLLIAHLASHASHPVHNLRLIRLVELVLVIRHDQQAGTLDWSEVGELLDRLDLWRFVFPAFRLVEHLAPGLLPAFFEQRLLAASTRLSRRVVASLATRDYEGWSDRRIEEHFMWCRNPWEFAAMVVELGWPAGLPFARLFALHGKRGRMLGRRLLFRSVD